MKFGWTVAVVLLIAGCGSGDGSGDGGGSDDIPPPPTTAPAPLPSFDPATKDRAQKLLDGALDGLVSDGTVSFESTVELFGATITQAGSVDLEKEIGTTVGTFKGKPFADVGGKFALEFRFIQDHVYGRPTSGPARKCWFDYGDSNPLFASNPDPWFPGPLAAVTNATPLGLANGMPDAVIVEVPAIGLLSMTSGKLAAKLAEGMDDAQIGEDAVSAKVLVKVHNERYARMQYNVNEVLDALRLDGVDVSSALVEQLPAGATEGLANSKIADMFVSYMNVSQVITFDPGGDVSVTVPPAEELVDATNITSKDSEDSDLCAGAGK